MTLFLLLVWLGSAWAGPLEDAQAAELERVRGEVAGQIQLKAYDLVDELVYGLTQEPPFAEPTPVVLAGVTVPVGLGTALQARLETHLSGVLLANPDANLQPVHCPQCSAVVVHSGPEGTVLSRGIDSPSTFEALGMDAGRHALFVDLEAEGTALVLRARLTQLTPDLPLVWSRTLAGTSGAPALLREATDLKSAEDARKEYLDALQDRGLVSIPVRVAIRTYAQPFNQRAIQPPPYIWLQSGAEISPTAAQAWRSSFVVGYSFAPQAYNGVMGQTRVSRLVTGKVRSRTRPDLYAFVGGTVLATWGPAAAAFRKPILTADELLNDADEREPRQSLGAWHVGADLRLGNRIGAAVFLENYPQLNSSANAGEYVYLLGIGFQSLGTEVSLCF